MRVEFFHRFLMDIKVPLGLPSMKVSELIRKISVLDIHTYEKKKYVFFYDVLIELSKYYMIEAIVNEQISDSKLFKNKNTIVEEKALLFNSMNEE
jgi:hypothetical protein